MQAILGTECYMRLQQLLSISLCILLPNPRLISLDLADIMSVVTDMTDYLGSCHSLSFWVPLYGREMKPLPFPKAVQVMRMYHTVITGCGT